MNGSIYFVFMELKILNYYFLNVCVSIPVFFLLESMIRRRVPFLRNFRNKLESEISFDAKHTRGLECD